MSKLKEREAWGRLVMSATGQGCGSGGTCATWDAQLSEPAGPSCPRLRASHSKENWGPEGLWFDAQELKLPFQAGLLPPPRGAWRISPVKLLRYFIILKSNQKSPMTTNSQRTRPGINNGLNQLVFV